MNSTVGAIVGDRARDYHSRSTRSDLEDFGLPLCGSTGPSRINEYLRYGLYKPTAERGKQSRVE
ncbi:unnamed protein product [Acanthoscelides obtectus]|uniref:Uncharacterized protein n=1 Tax=Acanthoscelides obtectus TaxID=200917 RepID=A0A9P0JKU5_ACAOB|nr:unnamed protein product [Acanthoscelides obtectus]CAK1672849.1 hypothetical protein AOBTE_LOCUS29113 [Acanthoscelides obtectus]